jgi:hypothetical protein
MDPDHPTDHEIVTLIIMHATTGERPEWAHSDAHLLATLRGCSEHEAAALLLGEVGELFCKLQGMVPRLPPHLAFDWPKTIAGVTGWDAPRVRAALKAAQDAGFLSGGPPSMVPGIDAARAAMLAFHQAISTMEEGLSASNVLTLDVLEQFSEILHGAHHAEERCKQALSLVLSTQRTVNAVLRVPKAVAFTDADGEKAVRTGANTARWRCPCRACGKWRTGQKASS